MKPFLINLFCVFTFLSCAESNVTKDEKPSVNSAKSDLVNAREPVSFSGEKPNLVNDKNGVALDGYDVVAYFVNHSKGIKKGVKGSSQFESKYKDITYRFLSLENKNRFDASPEDYVPQYGGWCAWAMAYGDSEVPVDYNSFRITKNSNGKLSLYLFYKSWTNNTLKKWLKGDEPELIKNADKTWEAVLEKSKTAS